MRWGLLGAALLASACTDDASSGATGGSSTSGTSAWATGTGDDGGQTDPQGSSSDAASGTDASACGDAVIVVGEQCDGDNLGGKTCASFGWDEAPGGLRCGPDCQLDLASCVMCGNGVVDQASEQCDGDASVDVQCQDTPGMADGPVYCTSECELDFGACESLCGNGKLDPDEACEGAGSGSCSDLYGPRWQGRYFCFDCEIQGDFCSLCGNGIVESDEQCDGSVERYSCENFFGPTAVGEITCNGCLLDASGCEYCGDGQTNADEVCDGGSLNGTTCADLGFASGDLDCASDCGSYDVGDCNACGNGALDVDEACDGNVFGATSSCMDLGFADGDLACSPDCALDLSACGSCGDGLLVPGEECDGMEFGDATCVTEVPGGSGGDLVCTPTCEIDTDSCLVMHPGAVIVTEILYAAAATPATTDGQWIEFHNTDVITWDLQGCLLESNFGFETIEIFDPLPIVPGDYAVLGTGDDAALFFTPDGPLDASYSLGNTGDLVRLICFGQTIDTVAFDDAVPWPDPPFGTTIAVTAAAMDDVSNDDGANWCASTSMIGPLTYGTPGAANDCP